MLLVLSWTVLSPLKIFKPEKTSFQKMCEKWIDLNIFSDCWPHVLPAFVDGFSLSLLP